MIDIRDHGGIFSGKGRPFKTLQTGIVVLSNKDTIINIDPVDLNSAIVEIDYFVDNNNYATNSHLNHNLFAIVFIDNQNIKITANNLITSGLVVVSWRVIEFENVKSIQRGINTFSNIRTINVRIENVDINKALVYTSSTATNSTNTTIPDVWCLGRLENSNTLVLSQQRTTIARTVYWQVVEFK